MRPTGWRLLASLRPGWETSQAARGGTGRYGAACTLPRHTTKHALRPARRRGRRTAATGGGNQARAVPQTQQGDHHLRWAPAQKAKWKSAASQARSHYKKCLTRTQNNSCREMRMYPAKLLAPMANRRKSKNRMLQIQKKPQPTPQSQDFQLLHFANAYFGRDLRQKYQLRCPHAGVLMGLISGHRQQPAAHQRKRGAERFPLPRPLIACSCRSPERSRSRD